MSKSFLEEWEDVIKMDYDVPEIQNKWIPKIGDRVKTNIKLTHASRESKRKKKAIIINIENDRMWLNIDNVLPYFSKDLIFIPSIEWFLEQMGINNPYDLEQLEDIFFEELYYDENLEIKNTIDKKEMSYLQFDIPYKDYLFRLFMFKQGKILKNNKWVKI